MRAMIQKIKGKYVLPVCTKCLDPFEDYERVYVNNFDENKRAIEQDLRHEECMEDSGFLWFDKNHEKMNRKYRYGG
jgi:hypothetical protein